jgi:hypothetical protein
MWLAPSSRYLTSESETMPSFKSRSFLAACRSTARTNTIGRRPTFRSPAADPKLDPAAAESPTEEELQFKLRLAIAFHRQALALYVRTAQDPDADPDLNAGPLGWNLDEVTDDLRNLLLRRDPEPEYPGLPLDPHQYHRFSLIRSHGFLYVAHVDKDSLDEPGHAPTAFGVFDESQIPVIDLE